MRVPRFSPENQDCKQVLTFRYERKLIALQRREVDYQSYQRNCRGDLYRMWLSGVLRRATLLPSTDCEVMRHPLEAVLALWG
jgi:hypothetical protein